MPRSCQEIDKKYQCQMNNQAVYPFFIKNKFIDFSEAIRSFSILFSTLLKILFLKTQNQGNNL